MIQHDPSNAVCRALRPFGTSIFTEMTALSNACGAINLSQGFPDFDGPEPVRRRAAEAILRGPNQYTPSHGTPELRRAVADSMRRFHGVEVDPDAEVTVTAGATEALAAALLGIVEPGDEVVLLDPSYDLYAPIVARAGGVAIHVPLEQPGFGLPRTELERTFGPRTRAIMINNPQNPCAKVYSAEELDFIGALCTRHGAIAIGDEVYEHLVYDGRRHTTLLAVASLKDRSIVISSTAKTFSMTGWKVGWAVSSARLTAAVRSAHQFLTFCTPGPLQLAMAEALAMDDDYYDGLLADYTRRREKLGNALLDLGFTVLPCEGTYYMSLSIAELDFEDDLAFCRYLTESVKVAAIPSSFFFRQREGGRDLVRLCFCKQDRTLDEAIRRLQSMPAKMRTHRR